MDKGDKALKTYRELLWFFRKSEAYHKMTFEEFVNGLVKYMKEKEKQNDPFVSEEQAGEQKQIENTCMSCEG